MIKVMVIAGSDTNRISEYINSSSGNSIKVEYNFQSISANLDTIDKLAIDIDKLILKVDTMSKNVIIRNELNYLVNLLSNPVFFRVKEIYFFCQETDTNKINFEYAMEQAGYNGYNVTTYKKTIALADIYNKILSVSEQEDSFNQEEIVYRYEKDNNAKRGYDPEVGFNRNIEGLPSNHIDRVELYEETKRNAIKSETGRYIVDERDSRIERIKLPENKISTVPTTNIILVTGRRRCGVSTFGMNLAESVVARGKTVSYIDLTQNPVIKTNGFMLDNKNLLLENPNITEGYRVFSGKLSSDYLKNSYLRYLMSNWKNYLATDYIFIEIDQDFIKSVEELCSTNILKVFFVIESVYEEMIAIKDTILELYKKYNIGVYINNYFRFVSMSERLRPSDVRAICPCQVINSINFDEEKLDISNLVLGGNN